VRARARARITSSLPPAHMLHVLQLTPWADSTWQGLFAPSVAPGMLAVLLSTMPKCTFAVAHLYRAYRAFSRPVCDLASCLGMQLSTPSLCSQCAKCLDVLQGPANECWRELKPSTPPGIVVRALAMSRAPHTCPACVGVTAPWHVHPAVVHCTCPVQTCPCQHWCKLPCSVALAIPSPGRRAGALVMQPTISNPTPCEHWW
jgi:hypothetical protein